MTKKSTSKKMAALGRRGGQANTAAQTEQRQRAAQHAGRPGRVCVDCGEPVFGGHKDRRQDSACSGRTWRWQRPSEK